MQSSISSYYDEIASLTKNDDVLKSELELICSEISRGKSVLDIGCGTGRHLLPLIKAGYLVDGLDKDDIHLNILKTKALQENIKLNRIFNLNLFNLEISQSYDGLLLFWNTINEICLSKEQLDQLMLKLKTLLKPNGKIIINVDDSSKLEPAKLHFKYQIDSNLNYEFQVIEFIKDFNITKSQERISEIKSKKEYTNILVQRWWGKDEIIAAARAKGFKTKTKHISNNSEIYLILNN